MKQFLFISAVFATCYGYPGQNPAGVGAYAYQNSDGTRYGGTYEFKDGEAYDLKDGKHLGSVNSLEGPFWFFPPDFFKNLQSFVPEPPFGYNPGFGPFFNPVFGGMNPGFAGMNPDFGYNGMSGGNSAFAVGSIGPGFSSQTAAISPPNPGMPNVNVASRFGEGKDSIKPQYYSVSTSSFASSSDVNGKRKENRGAQTVVNNNGKVTEYTVHN